MSLTLLRGVRIGHSPAIGGSRAAPSEPRADLRGPVLPLLPLLLGGGSSSSREPPRLLGPSPTLCSLETTQTQNFNISIVTMWAKWAPPPRRGRRDHLQGTLRLRENHAHPRAAAAVSCRAMFGQAVSQRSNK